MPLVAGRNVNHIVLQLVAKLTPMTATAADFPFRRATKVIAVADVVESVRLMELGEREFVARWHSFIDFVHEQLKLHSGRLHRSLGDGMILEFREPTDGLRAAIALVRRVCEDNRLLPPEHHVHLRIGVHLAEVLADDYDIYGTDVNVASRIATLAGPGEVVISAALRERLGRAWPPHLPLYDLGPCHLKHVKHPVHAFRIPSPEGAPVLPALPMEIHDLRASIALRAAGTDEAAPALVGEHPLGAELASALSRSDALQLVTRLAPPREESGQALPGTIAPVSARYLLTGASSRGAATRAVYAELSETEGGRVIWAECLEHSAATAAGNVVRPAQLVAAVHSAVIAHEMKLAKSRMLPTLEGSSLLLAALGYMHRLCPIDIEEARGLLEHLLGRWRRHPTANAWLSHLHVLRLQQSPSGPTPPDAALAHVHAVAAVQGAPESALVLGLDGHASLHGHHNAEAARERYEQALCLQPGHSLVQLFRAELLAMRGSARAARSAVSQASDAIVLEPLQYMYDAVAALAALADHDAEAAVHFAQRSLLRNPRYLPAMRTLIVAQVEANRLGDAHAVQQQLLRRFPAFTLRRFLGSTPVGEDLEARMAEGLREAGVPEV